MQIKVTNQDYKTVMNEDGTFRCEHKSIEIEPPCCDGRDCGCHGLYTVHCNDCDDRDLEEWQAQDILDKYN